MVFLVAKLAAGRFAVKLPVDSGPVTIYPAVPRTSFPSERARIGYASLAEALTSKQADFNLRLIEPASMRGMRDIRVAAFVDLVSGNAFSRAEQAGRQPVGFSRCALPIACLRCELRG
jgi:hypothetical protein